MNESRQRQLLDGQTNTARKVFEMVPIQEAWRDSDISRSLRVAGTTGASLHVIRGCLGELESAGLVRRVSHGQYQRTPVNKHTAVGQTNVPNPQPTAQPKSEPAMQEPTPKAPMPAPLDLLGAVAADLALMASEFAARIKTLAARVEEVGLSVEAQREADAAAMAKASRLQALLKEVMS